MRWAEETTLEFVRAYLKQECLWNPKNENYRRRYGRDQAYMEIASTLKEHGLTITIPEVRLKIKSLRSTYCQEINKIVKKSHDPDKMYESSLVWFKEMDNCLKTLAMGKVRNPDQMLKQSKEESLAFDLWENDESKDEDKEGSSKDDDMFEITISDPLVNDLSGISNHYEETSDKSEGMAHIKMELDENKPLHTKLKRKLKSDRFKSHYSRQKEYSRERQVDDEFDLYGRYVASQLRKLSIARALKMQLEIQTLLSKARLAEF